MPDVNSNAPEDVRLWVALDVHKLSIIAAMLPPTGGQPEVSQTLLITSGRVRPAMRSAVARSWRPSACRRPTGRRRSARGAKSASSKSPPRRRRRSQAAARPAPDARSSRPAPLRGAAARAHGSGAARASRGPQRLRCRSGSAGRCTPCGPRARRVRSGAHPRLLARRYIDIADDYQKTPIIDSNHRTQRNITWSNRYFGGNWIRLDGRGFSEIILTAVVMVNGNSGKQETWYPMGRKYIVTVGASLL